MLRKYAFLECFLCICCEAFTGTGSTFWMQGILKMLLSIRWLFSDLKMEIRKKLKSSTVISFFSSYKRNMYTFLVLEWFYFVVDCCLWARPWMHWNSSWMLPASCYIFLFNYSYDVMLFLSLLSVLDQREKGLLWM